MERRVAEFCDTLEGRPSAYSYIPLTDDEMRIKVMKSRLFNEIRAGEIFGMWLKTTPESQTWENVPYSKKVSRNISFYVMRTRVVYYFLIARIVPYGSQICCCGSSKNESSSSA